MISGVSVDLKKMDENDIELVRQWRNSRDVSVHMISQSIISEEKQIRWFESVKDSVFQLYFVIQSMFVPLC